MPIPVSEWFFVIYAVSGPKGRGMRTVFCRLLDGVCGFGTSGIERFAAGAGIKKQSETYKVIT
jgi:hypothetical protein